jgi:hypothetical protein
MSSFKELEIQENHRFAEQPQFGAALQHIHQKVDQQQGFFSLFSSVVELFLPQTINTALKMVGSETEAIQAERADSPEDGFDDRWPMPGGFEPSGRG